MKNLLLLILLCPLLTFSQTKAFPSAFGAASSATGGRYGTVKHVTNLNNSGSGSFREAVSGSNRTIVFDVSGTIELTSNLQITAHNITVAGQSAPLGGITITGKPIFFQKVENVVFRYIRFRPDYNSVANVDALNAYSCKNLIIDHCSISWGGDEAFSIVGASTNITVQNNIFGESKTGMIAGDSNNPISNNFSIIGNLWYNISHRFPNISANRTDVINNVVHNWNFRLMVVGQNGHSQLNEINNYFQPGRNTYSPTDVLQGVNWLDIGSASERSNIKVYTNGNVYPGFLSEGDDNWKMWVHRFNVTGGAYAGIKQGDYGHSDFRSSNPFAILGDAKPITSAAEARLNVISNAGANKYLNSDGSTGTYHDEVDEIYLEHVSNGTSEYYAWPPTNIVNKQSYRDFHNSVSNVPINERSSNFDTDRDGMADQWEMNLFGNLSKTANGDEDGDGYTNLEEYLNGTDIDSNIAYQVNAGEDDEICEGESIILTGSDATTYRWSAGGRTTANITVYPVITTTYTLTGTHPNGSTTTDTVTITVYPKPDANAGEDQNICEGESVTLSASGGDSYQWSNGETTQSIEVTPNSTTIYSVQVTRDGCAGVSTDDVQVNVTSIPIVDAGEDVTISMGNSTTLTASGADSYEWSTGETTQSIEVAPNADTVYTITGWIGNCSSSDTVTVFSIDDSVVANAGDDAVICDGQETILTASGGDYYLWNTGETTNSITVSPNTTTTYSVTVSNDTNSDIDEVTVIVNPLPTAYAGEDVTINNGETTTLVATGGESYLWSTGETTQSINVYPNTTTTYSVTAIENGCEASDEVIVFVETSENVIANAGDDKSICEGETITLSASGGLYFLWNNGETTPSISVSPDVTTTYSVTVSNDHNSATDEVTVVVNLLPTVHAGNDLTITEGESTTLTASGGDTYLWSTGETSASITVSPNTTTTYEVTAFSNGCEATDDIVVNVESAPNVVADAGEDQTICNGTNTTLTASGGDTYVWNTGDTSASITVNPNETTTYTVTVANGFTTDTDDVTIFVNPTPSVNAGDNVTIIVGESTTLTATGGDTYLWNTGETSASITVNPNATTTYEVTAFSNGCEAADDVVVTVESAPIVLADAGEDQTICNGTSVTLTATGGDSYLWNTGETTASITVNPSVTVTYNVSVSDGITTDSDDVTVFVNPIPEANAGSNVTITEGENTTLTASGGDTYLWNTGETTASIIVHPEETTVYYVTAYKNGCEGTDEVTVTVETSTDNVLADAGENQYLCQGDQTTLTASGGNSYLWSTGETTRSISVNPISTTNYTVVVSNGSNSDSDEVTVFVDQKPNVNVSSNKPKILIGEYVTLSATGANEYLWSNGATQPNIAVAPYESTTYNVTGFNNNCSDQISISVEVLEYVIADAGIDETICFGESLTLTASATGGDAFLWSTGATTKSITVNPDDDTTYSVIVSNELDSHADQVTVFVQNCDIDEEVVLTPDPFVFEVYLNQRATDDLNVKIAGLTEETQLFMHDILGKRIYFETLDANGGQEFVKHISLDNISAGVYVITLIENGINKSKKVLLE